MHEPIITTLLILVTSAIAIWAFERPSVQDRLMFIPEAILVEKQSYRLLTACLPHCGGWPHLLINMYSLYVLGCALEFNIGPTRFLTIYLGSVVGGNLFCLYVHRFHDYAAAGASGGICGLLLAQVLWNPAARFVLFPAPLLVPGWLYAIGFLIASFYAMKEQYPAIAHDAHLGGAITGLGLMAILHPELARRHWMVFLLLSLITCLIVLYVARNPLFLPLSSFIPICSATPRRKDKNAKAKPRLANRHTTKSAKPLPAPPEPDWLVAAIEDQVGTLMRDPKGMHDWIDKFGRTYRVISAAPENFEFQTFVCAITSLLNLPGLNYLILDTRQLQPAQMAQVRPFIGNLPDAQFNRIIRSYGFESR
jgi:membrane associated rhomboid family serine protease